MAHESWGNGIAADIIDGKHDADLRAMSDAIKVRLKMAWFEGQRVRVSATENPTEIDGLEGFVLKVNTNGSVAVGFDPELEDAWLKPSERSYRTAWNIAPEHLVSLETWDESEAREKALFEDMKARADKRGKDLAKTLKPGDRVQITATRPKYLVGLIGEVVKMIDGDTALIKYAEWHRAAAKKYANAAGEGTVLLSQVKVLQPKPLPQGLALVGGKSA